MVDSMILSDDAKRFAIAREIERAKTMSYITCSAILPLLIGVGYLISRTVNKKFMLLKKPPHIRVKMYAFFVAMVPTLSLLLEDLNANYTETHGLHYFGHLNIDIQL